MALLSVASRGTQSRDLLEEQLGLLEGGNRVGPAGKRSGGWSWAAR